MTVSITHRLRIFFGVILLFISYPLWAAQPDAGVQPDTSTTPEPTLGMGHEFKSYAEEVANRVDRIIKKKAFDLWGDPWMVQGIPLILPASSTGFNLGLKVNFQNIRRQDPHKLEIELQVLASDQGRYKHFFKLDIPHAFDGKFRLTARVAYDRDINLRYYGIGNFTTVDYSRVNYDDPIYNTVRATPSIDVQLLRNLGKYLRMGPFIGFRWTNIMSPSGSLLGAEHPVGTAGGRTHYFGAAIVHDTTDFEPYPSRGTAQDLYVYWYAPFLGSEYNFRRFSYTLRNYIPVHPELIIASRLLVEGLDGNIPFYELGAVGGQNPALGIGGSRYFRGWDNDRFMDNVRVALGVEFRWDPLSISFAKQDLTVSFVPFFDIGRVWPSVFPIKLDNWHADAGWGVRLLWDHRFVIRGDMAVTAERVSFYLDLNNNF